MWRCLGWWSWRELNRRPSLYPCWYRSDPVRFPCESRKPTDTIRHQKRQKPPRRRDGCRGGFFAFWVAYIRPGKNQHRRGHSGDLGGSDLFGGLVLGECRLCQFAQCSSPCIHGIALGTEGISDLFTGTAGAEAGHAQVLLGAGIFFSCYVDGDCAVRGLAPQGRGRACRGQGSTSPMILSIASCTVPPSGGR